MLLTSDLWNFESNVVFPDFSSLSHETNLEILEGAGTREGAKGKGRW